MLTLILSSTKNIPIQLLVHIILGIKRITEIFISRQYTECFDRIAQIGDRQIQSNCIALLINGEMIKRKFKPIFLCKEMMQTRNEHCLSHRNSAAWDG